jgi:hypothetical protein
MRHLIRICIVLIFMLALGSPTPMSTQSQAPGLPAPARVAQSRLVVLETFMRPG